MHDGTSRSVVVSLLILLLVLLPRLLQLLLLATAGIRVVGLSQRLLVPLPRLLDALAIAARDAVAVRVVGRKRRRVRGALVGVRVGVGVVWVAVLLAGRRT